MHHHHYHYILRHEFLPGVKNDISDLPSCSGHLLETELPTHYNVTNPQSMQWRM